MRKSKIRRARIPAQAPSYGALLKLVKVAIARHLKALCKMRAREDGSALGDYEGYLTASEIENCRRLLKDLHSLAGEGEPAAELVGTDPSKMTDEELKEATKILSMG